jgi:CBS domain-containing protein
MQDGVTVRDVMSREFVGVSESDDVASVLDVMVNESISSIVVLRGTTPIGVVQDLDVLELVARRDRIDDVNVAEVMRTPPEPIGPDADVETALDRLSSGWDRQLPVTDPDEQLVGVVSESDVLAAAAALFATGDRSQGDRRTLQTETAESNSAGQVSSARASDAYTNHDRTSSVTTAEADGTRTETGLTQGVCESCGSLVGDLGGHNGQLLCRECRDV